MTRSFIAPNSAIGSFFRNLPETLQQPASLGMIGSFGAHILFFATLPAFTSPEPTNPDREIRRVQVIDLPQQGQAAQPFTSQVKLPPVPKTSTTQKIPVPNRLTVPGANSSTLIAPNPLYTIPGLSNPVPPPPVPQMDFTELLKRFAARRPPIARIPQTQPPRPRPSTQPVSPSPGSFSTSSIDGLKPYDPSQIGETQPQPTQSPSPQPSTSPSPTATPATQDPALAQRIALQNEYLVASQYNPTGTDPQGYGERLNQLLKSDLEALRRGDYATAQFPAENNQPAIELTSKLPFAIQNYRQNEALIAVKVGTDGKMIGEPQLINRTGYPNSLDREAVEYVKQEVAKLPAPQKKTVYFYRLKFKPPAPQPTTQNQA